MAHEIERVVTIRPPGNPFVACFDHVARAFAGALGVKSHDIWPGSDNIPDYSLVLGAHLIAMKPVPGPVCENCVIWNSENLHSGWFSSRYKRLMEGNAVWDYDRANLSQWEGEGIEAEWVPLGWHESMRENWEPKLLGVPMHFGSMNERRDKVLKAARITNRFGVYGDKLRGTLAEHGAVINIHYHMPGMFEIVRASQLFANGMPVLSEECQDDHWESVLPPGTFCPYDQLAERITAGDYPSGDDQRAAYEAFPLVDILENL